MGAATHLVTMQLDVSFTFRAQWGGGWGVDIVTTQTPKPCTPALNPVMLADSGLQPALEASWERTECKQDNTSNMFEASPYDLQVARAL